MRIGLTAAPPEVVDGVEVIVGDAPPPRPLRNISIAPYVDYTGGEG